MDAAGEGLEKAFGGVEGRESWKTAEGEVDFGDSSISAEIFHAVCEGWIELRSINKIEESALGVDAGYDGFDGNLFTAGEHNAGNGSVFDANLLDFGVSADLRTGLFRGFGESMREVAKPATRKSSRANGVSITGGAHEKNGCGTSGPGTERRAENAASGNDGADEFGLEELRDEIRDGHGAPAEEIEDAVLAERAHAPARLKEVPEVFGAGLVDRRWRDRNKLVENSREVVERVGEFDEFSGVFGGDAGNAGSGLGVVVPEKERVAIGCGSEDARTGIENFASECFELHVARNIGAERAERVRKCGGAEAGMKFLGDGATADENYTLSEGHGQLAAFDAVAAEREERPFHSFRMTWLAMRPLAPMMPPPGCVAEPHI